jgi:hypothetical protein
VIWIHVIVTVIGLSILVDSAAHWSDHENRERNFLIGGLMLAIGSLGIFHYTGVTPW